jgi:hypothetical protein
MLKHMLHYLKGYSIMYLRDYSIMELQRDMDLVPSLIDSDLPRSSSFRAVRDNGLPKILGGLIVYLSTSTVRSG